MPNEKVLRFIAIHIVLVLLGFKVGMYAYNYHQEWYYSDSSRFESLAESNLKTWDNLETARKRAKEGVKLGSVFISTMAGLSIFFSLSYVARVFFSREPPPILPNNP